MNERHALDKTAFSCISLFAGAFTNACPSMYSLGYRIAKRERKRASDKRDAIDAEKRHRESESAQAGINLSKKQKVSGAGAIDKIGDSINNLAETLERNHSNAPSEQVFIHKQALADATVGSTIQGLAAEKVQEEACLTPEGQIFMLELLDKESLARTYVALKSEKLRTMWLKKQLVQNDGDLEEIFIDWENESQN